MNKHLNNRKKLIYDTIYDNDNSVNITQVDLKRKKCIVLPYLGEISEKIIEILRKRKIKTIFSVPLNLKIIIKSGQDSLEKVNEKAAVYQLKSKNCEKFYVGQTGRLLQESMTTWPIEEEVKNITT